MDLETSKIRDRVLKYCEGRGIDIGCGQDKIKPDATGIDNRGMPGGVDMVLDASKPLPFNDGELDYVYSSHALEDMLDTGGILKEWVRILKSGGYIILYVPHPDFYKGGNPCHKFPGFTPEQLESILKEIGCKIVETSIDDRPGCYSTLVVASKL
jgi:ubiquinone/menaquinone biosynthesis C-methylase UbiE